MAEPFTPPDKRVRDMLLKAREVMTEPWEFGSGRLDFLLGSGAVNMTVLYAGMEYSLMQTPSKSGFISCVRTCEGVWVDMLLELPAPVVVRMSELLQTYLELEPE